MPKTLLTGLLDIYIYIRNKTVRDILVCYFILIM